MTREEFGKYLTAAANPDTAPDALASIKSGVDELFTTSETATATLADNAKTIADLRDTNMRMFLRQVGESGGQEEDKEETLEEYNRRFAAEMNGEVK